MTRRLASGPLLKNLLLGHRMTINDAMRAGRYGPSVFNGRIRYVDLAGVEAFHGITFTDEQIERAIEGRPDRLLFIPETEDDHVWKEPESRCAAGA